MHRILALEDWVLGNGGTAHIPDRLLGLQVHAKSAGAIAVRIPLAFPIIESKEHHRHKEDSLLACLLRSSICPAAFQEDIEQGAGGRNSSNNANPSKN